MRIKRLPKILIVVIIFGCLLRSVLAQNSDLEPKNFRLDVSKVTSWTQSQNVVGFTITVMAMQVIISLGWIIVGTLWYALAMSTSANPSMHQRVMLFEFMFGPDFVLDNLFRCFTIFSFLAGVMVVKTILTIGVFDTMHYFEEVDRNKAYNILTAEKFIQATLIRAFANGVFLIVGWSLVAVLAKKKLAIFNSLLQGRKRRKRRRRSFSNQFQAEFTPFLIEADFNRLLEKLTE